MNGDNRHHWETYAAREIKAVAPLLLGHGYTLDDEQPHVAGERYVMRAVTTTSGKKLVLIGRHIKTNDRVIIKISSDAEGRKELEHERRAKELLNRLRFAYDVFFTPRELLFVREDVYTIAIYEFIEQERPFLERTLEEQFTFALWAFKAQEGAHATANRHQRLIRGVFETYASATYRARFNEFQTTTLAFSPSAAPLLDEVGALLGENEEIVDRYGKFLVHTDFVPHNFRIKSGAFYLLDFSSLRFGNKYEGWARFLNFMALYNPALEQALTKYVARNRSTGEQESLHVMRLYRLTELVAFYVSTLSRAEGSLKELNTARIYFWLAVLEATLNHTPLPDKVREEYKKLRDSLRSDEEKQRQKDLH